MFSLERQSSREFTYQNLCQFSIKNFFFFFLGRGRNPTDLSSDIQRLEFQTCFSNFVNLLKVLEFSEPQFLCLQNGKGIPFFVFLVVLK